jgi:hypothetical protein
MLVKTFKKACQLLRILKIEYGQEHDYGKQGTDKRHKFDIELFSNIKLPFSPLEWCQLCMKDGFHYMGGCCGTCSAIQDIVEQSFRFESGWISVHHLAEIAGLWESHGEDGKVIFSKEPKKLYLKAFKAGFLTPWEKMALIWHIIKDYQNPRVPDGFGDHMQPADAAVSLLGRALQHLSIARSFDSAEQNKLEGAGSQKEAQYLITLSRVIPALHTLNEQITELAPPPFEGFALIEKKAKFRPEAICSNGMGLCIYRTQEEVDKTLAIWRENEAKYEETTAHKGKVDDRIGVCKVRITLEKGLEFIV